ncbi:hypothetical protein WJ967_19565 [Achromobacter xylosoxidans]
MPSGGSSSLPSLSRVFSEGLSFSPSVNVARNMQGRSINDAIAALGEPSRNAPSATPWNWSGPTTRPRLTRNG